MKVVINDVALEDIEAIRAYLAVHYPYILFSVRRRIQIALARIERFPEAAPLVVGRAGVRVISLVRYPYKIFYQIHDNTIEIIHITHASRQ